MADLLLLHRRLQRGHDGCARGSAAAQDHNTEGIERTLVKHILELRDASVRASHVHGRDGRTPFCVKAEHSTYLTAPSSLARRSPASWGTGRCFCLLSLSRTVLSSLKSICVPTMRQGTPGQWWWTSGNHFSFTFSKEAGEVTLKQTRKTSVCG
jgi:hypothetical protein